MQKRFKMSNKKSKKKFSQGSKRVHKFNAGSTPHIMRGGIRL